MFNKMKVYQRVMLIEFACLCLGAMPQAWAYKQISAGDLHTCGLKNDNSIVCWGDNFSNQSTSPVGNFVQVSAGYGHTCALKNNGSVVCWGGSGAGRSIPPSGNFTQISAGDEHTCGLQSDATVICWGWNTPPTGNFIQVSAGRTHDCGLTQNDMSIACWGSSSSAGIFPSGRFTQVSVGHVHSCGLRDDSSVTCWGAGKTYLGYPEEYGQAASPLGSFVQIDSGFYHSCGLKNDGNVICWGAGKTNTRNNFEYGQSIPPNDNFTQISTGSFHTCGLKNDGDVVCWGRNDFGQSTPPEDNSLPSTFVLTLHQTGTGQGTTSGGGTFMANTIINLVATPDANSTFVDWSSSPCNSSFQMPANNLTCTANFTLKQFNLTLNKTGNGQISGGGSFTANSSVNLSATPDVGWSFNGWSPTPCNFSFIMPANDLTCTATFSQDCNYSLNLTSANHSANAENGSFNLTVTNGCNWSASSNQSWVRISNPSGSGNATISYSVDANPNTTARSATISVNGQSFTVNQAAKTISLIPDIRIEPTTLNF